MITYYLSKIRDKKLKENFVSGLAFGLASGLAFGLASGLALTFGLAFGLVFGLASGLASGLTSPLWLVILITVIIGEIIFWFFDKAKYNGKESKWWFTIKRKAENLFESSLVTVNTINIIKIFPTIKWQEVSQFTLKGIVFIIIGTCIAGLVIGWLWMNKLKYRNIKEKRKVQK